MLPVSVRPFTTQDEAAVFQLWAEMLNGTWPIDRQDFQRILLNNLEQGTYSVAITDNKIVGFMAVLTDQGQHQAQITGLVVSNQFSFAPIAQALLTNVFPQLVVKGVRTCTFGAGTGPYFWPGIPTNLPQLLTFFQTADWQFTEECVDMTLELKNYQTPPFVYDRLNQARVTIDFLDPMDLSKLLVFEKTYFPEWLNFFTSETEQAHYSQILVAKTQSGEIIGSVLVRKETNFVWRKLLGENVGTIGALGVSEQARGQGVGLALAAQATEQLQAQAVNVCYLGWTWLVNWYGQLGYSEWRKYQLASKSLQTSTN